MRRTRQNAGFTLVELLVVVAIIGVLLALMVPALQGAKENTRTVLCKSRLKQLGVAMNAYMSNERGFLPYEDRPDSKDPNQNAKCWFDSLDKYVGTEDKKKGIKVCPTVALDAPNVEESFRMNSKLAETNPNNLHFRNVPYRQHSTLSSPGSTVVLFDGDTGGDTISFKGRWREKNDDVSYRHNNRTNILFADWHSDTFGKKELKRKSKKNDIIIWQPPDMGLWKPDPQP